MPKQRQKTLKSSRGKPKNSRTIQSPKVPQKVLRKDVKTNTATNLKIKQQNYRKTTKLQKVKKPVEAPVLSLFYQFFPLIEWVEFQMLQFFQGVSRDATLQSTKVPFRITKDKLARLLTPTRLKALRRFLSEMAMTLPPDDRILILDFLKNGRLPEEIRLDYTDLPEEFFKIPVTAKVRTAIRALLTLEYSPTDIVPVISQAFPGLHFTTEAIQKFRDFYWNVGDLMDTAEGQAASRNKITQVKADILSGRNFIDHTKRLAASGKTTEVEILKAIVRQKHAANQDSIPGQNPDIYWVATPFLETDDRDHFSPWPKVGSSNSAILPMTSFNLITEILSGHIDPLDLALQIGIFPSKYSDVTQVLQNLVPIIAIKLSKLINSHDMESTATYLNKIALPFSNFLRNLGIPAVPTSMSSLSDQINQVYRNADDFTDIFEMKGGIRNAARS